MEVVRPKLARLCDFEWASACQYIVYVSSIAGLHEVSADSVHSLSVVRGGVRGARMRKQKVLALLVENVSLLDAFVSEHSDDLGELELAILRSMRSSFKVSQVTVNEKLDWIDIIEGMVQDNMLGERVTDEVPF